MTENRKLVVPKAGMKVPDPERRDYLPPGGRIVDLHGPYLQHWARRIADGDVTVRDVQGESEAVNASNPTGAAADKTKPRPVRNNQADSEG